MLGFSCLWSAQTTRSSRGHCRPQWAGSWRWPARRGCPRTHWAASAGAPASGPGLAPRAAAGGCRGRPASASWPGWPSPTPGSGSDTCPRLRAPASWITIMLILWIYYGGLPGYWSVMRCEVSSNIMECSEQWGGVIVAHSCRVPQYFNSVVLFNIQNILWKTCF